MQTFNSR